MELDDILTQLNQDLNNSLNQANQSLKETIGMSSHINDVAMMFCPECGSKIEATNAFCPNCGTRLTVAINEDYECIETGDYTEDDGGIEPRYRGILFTDTARLAGKYEIDRDYIVDSFHDIMAIDAEDGIIWNLLDVEDFRQQLGEDPFWMDYNQLISDFMEKLKYPYGIQTPVFIIGGDDVIPIPQIEDVFGSSDTGKMPCDMCYCFSGDFFSELWDGDHKICEDYVRNTVSRLPLEDGELETEFKDDILYYFQQCSQYYKEGIPADWVMMIANASWLPASKTMSEHLPLICEDNNSRMVKDDMYVAPPVEPDNEKVIKSVSESMHDAGMLLFNLHGADGKGMSSFYSDNGEAFCREMLQYSRARVFNTVACYGARYHGYKRNDSMLLTAFYDYGVLLYAGSLIPVPMTDPDVPDGVVVHDGSGSEHLMPIFCMEQYAGLPAGEAMIRAKLEYFNTFRHLERDDFSLATIQMFSLYGNPMLRLQRNEHVLRKAEEEHVLPHLPQNKQIKSVNMKRMQRIMTKEESSSSLLANIRGAVDVNLDAIHKAIVNNLYVQLGLEPRTLHHIDAYSIQNSDGSTDKGFMYAFIDDELAFANKTWVEVSETGKVKRMYRTK